MILRGKLREFLLGFVCALLGIKSTLARASCIALRREASGDGGPGWQYDACAMKILEIEQGFQSYEKPPRSPETPTLPGEPR
ncbi:hypothetical protein [Burkholderia sp. JKS000303]|uniref:hypothetical protein n=1 Tax=Burkholderia sp. JKS000303 TaxID=1938747 RepID=UPI000BF5B2B3|nr:hypothetical protein [Burkholderia sp. JKS000303]